MVQRTKHPAHVIIAAILGITGVAVVLSLGVAMLDPNAFFGWIVAIPGRFLFTILHVAAWWVPLYILILAGLTGRKAPLTWSTIVLLNLVHVPVLTIAAILQLFTADGEALSPLPSTRRSVIHAPGCDSRAQPCPRHRGGGTHADLALSCCRPGGPGGRRQ